MRPFTTQRYDCGRTVQASKGFGTTKPSPGKGKPSGKAVREKDIKEALSQSRKPQRHSDVRPIDEREAARGKVDFAQVTSWGSESTDAGDLQVKSYTESFRGDDSRPFYEQLARALELAQARGLMKVAELGKPLPPFEQWAFKAEHYTQYLQDQLVVHQALVDACSAAVQAVSGAVTTDGKSTDAPWHHASLACFASTGSLTRAAALQQDVEKFANSPAGKDSSEKSRSYPPGGMATSYALLISRLGRDIIGAETEQEREEAAGKLFAHAYSIHATHLTTGMRIGAAATEKLGLMHAGAVHYYSDYPAAMTDPLASFVKHVNLSGASASELVKRSIMDEVPNALLKTSLLLAALAQDS